MPANRQYLVRQSQGFAATQAFALQPLGESAPDCDGQCLAGQTGDLPRQTIGLIILEVQSHRPRRVLEEKTSYRNHPALSRRRCCSLAGVITRALSSRAKRGDPDFRRPLCNPNRAPNPGFQTRPGAAAEAEPLDRHASLAMTAVLRPTRPRSSHLLDLDQRPDEILRMQGTAPACRARRFSARRRREPGRPQLSACRARR